MIIYGFTTILVNEIMNELVINYRNQIINNKKCKFVFVIPEGSDNLSIDTGRVRLRWVLNNLIYNAVKHRNAKVETAKFGSNLK